MSGNFKFVINIQEATAHLIIGQTKVCLEIWMSFQACISTNVLYIVYDIHVRPVIYEYEVYYTLCVHKLYNVFPFGSSFIEIMRVHLQIFCILLFILLFFLLLVFIYYTLHFRVFSRIFTIKATQTQHECYMVGCS